MQRELARLGYYHGPTIPVVPPVMRTVLFVIKRKHGLINGAIDSRIGRVDLYLSQLPQLLFESICLSIRIGRLLPKRWA